MAKIHEEDTQPSRLHPATNVEKPVILKGDFAEGERTLPPEPVGPDFARGLRTIPAPKNSGDFASGEHTMTATSVAGDFASGEHSRVSEDDVDQTLQPPPAPVTSKRRKS
jgi:hypothetical protein